MHQICAKMVAGGVWGKISLVGRVDTWIFHYFFGCHTCNSSIQTEIYVHLLWHLL